MWTIPEYPIKIQAWIPAALGALHNFIHLHDPHDDVFQYAEEAGNEREQEKEQGQLLADYLSHHISPEEKLQASAQRDRITQAC